MTTPAEDRPRITRPGAGVAVDPRAVLRARHKKFLKRWQLSDRITELGMTDSAGKPVTLGKDFLGKIEAGTRRPSLDSFRALCAALEVDPSELMPGGRVTTLPKELRERKARLDHNRDLRDFATPRRLKYKNPETGRVYYGKKLRAAYAAWVHLRSVTESGDEAAVRDALAGYENALAQVPPAPGSEDDDLDEPGQDLLAS